MAPQYNILMEGNWHQRGCYKHHPPKYCYNSSTQLNRLPAGCMESNLSITEMYKNKLN